MADPDLLNESFEANPGYDDATWNEDSPGAGSVVDEDNTDISRPTGGGNQLLKVQKVSPNFRARPYNDLGGSMAIVYFQGYVNVTAHGLTVDGQELRLIDLMDNTGNSSITLKLGRISGAPHFYLSYFENSGFQGYDAGAINTSQWYKTRLLYDITNHLYDFQVDGVSQKSGTLREAHRANVRYIGLGDAVNNYTLTVYYDLIQVSSTGWLTLPTSWIPKVIGPF